MSVFPGYGGQSFIPATLDRVSVLKMELAALGSKALLQVDGGIHPGNVARLKEAGADLFVIGTALFNATDIAGKIKEFENQLYWSRS
jgi:ribulose-phosphate 3-epimerase